jgi:putative ABC transport system substrate-binding protein
MRRRREFITLIGGALVSATLPIVAHAQQVGRPRRIGMVLPFDETDQESRARVTAFHAGLHARGWIEGRNLQIDERWSGGESTALRRDLDEVAASNPELIVTGHTLVAQWMKQSRPAIPCVFIGIADPIGSGVVASLARPDGNITGFTAFEYAICGKWLSLLKEMSPRIERVGLLFNTATTPWAEYFWRAFESSASSNGIFPVRMDVRNAQEVERAIIGLAREPGAGLMGVPEVTLNINRQLVLDLATRHRLPAIYPYRYFPAGGGLASYGIDVEDMWKRSASYVDRILKGAKPAELPVQAPTRFEFVVNLKTAKALGLTIPESFLLTADEVIE